MLIYSPILKYFVTFVVNLNHKFFKTLSKINWKLFSHMTWPTPYKNLLEFFVSKNIETLHTCRFPFHELNGASETPIQPCMLKKWKIEKLFQINSRKWENNLWTSKLIFFPNHPHTCTHVILILKSLSMQITPQSNFICRR
jgi:hypothetical protein